jgi:uncharacterized protein (DUF1501 family)
MSKPTRREFIKYGAGAIGAGAMLPVLNRGASVVRELANNQIGDGRILVIVELEGGIDGLGVVTPLQQYDIYASLRPMVGVPKERVLPLFGSTTMGMTPELADLKPIADAGKMAVIQAVGYPQPNLSHFSSRDIWYSGVPDSNLLTAHRTGWIGRHSALFGNRGNSLDTVSAGRSVNLTLYASGATAAGIDGNNLGNYQFLPDPATSDAATIADRNNQLRSFRTMDESASPSPYLDLVEKAELDALNSSDQVLQANNSYLNRTGAHAGHTHPNYPTSGRVGGFARGLQLIAALATAAPTHGTRVYYASAGGFDTHAYQANYRVTPVEGDHPALVAGVARSLRAFYDDLIAHNLADRVVILIWSEFGRRVAQNDSNGTDHGEANNVILLGGRVKGGVYGADPSLTDLHMGNLKYKIDYRQVYATLIRDWLGGDPAPVLNGSFNTLGFIA